MSCTHLCGWCLLSLELQCQTCYLFLGDALALFLGAMKKVALFALKTDLVTCGISSAQQHHCVCPLLVFLCQAPVVAFRTWCQLVPVWALRLEWRLWSSFWFGVSVLPVTWPEVPATSVISLTVSGIVCLARWFLMLDFTGRL